MKFLEKIVNSEIAKGITKIVGGIILATCLYHTSPANAQETPQEYIVTIKKAPKKEETLEDRLKGKLIFGIEEDNVDNYMYTLDLIDKPFRIRRLGENVTDPKWTSNGQIVLNGGKRNTEWIELTDELQRYTRKFATREIREPEDFLRNPYMSPDGKCVTFDNQDQLFIVDLRTNRTKQLTHLEVPKYGGGGDDTSNSSISSDNKKAIFTSWVTESASEFQGGRMQSTTAKYYGSEIYTINLDGTELTKITESKGYSEKSYKASPIFINNNSSILFLSHVRDSSDLYDGVYIIDTSGKNKKRLIEDMLIKDFTVSPDERYIIYTKTNPYANVYDLVVFDTETKEKVTIFKFDQNITYIGSISWKY